MAKRFYVIDEEHNLAWNEKAETAKLFLTEKAATDHARELAESEAGKTFWVLRAVAEVIAKPMPVTVRALP